MATVRTTALIDDLDGEPADETVTFALDGIGYQIDLSTANAHLLRGPLARFIIAARPISTPLQAARDRRRSARSGVPVDSSPRDVRAWAAEQGVVLSGRGRIPLAVIVQYRDAHR